MLDGYRAVGEVTVEFSLAWLLRPLATKTFLDEVWGTQHWVVERDCAGYYDDLLHSSSVVEQLLRAVRHDPSAVRMVKGRQKKGADDYRGADGTVDTRHILDGLAAGYTIVLDSVERYARPIASLAHSIEVELNFATQVNAYVTPPHSQGLIPHWDDHDVLILQMKGSKIWHLYHGADVPPQEMRLRKAIDTAALPSPTDLVLEAGDLLYVPRGRVHAAEATAESSVHLTVGIHAPTVLTVLIRALQSLDLRDERVHARLPPRHLDDATARAQVGALVHDALSIVRRADTIDESLDALADVLVRHGRCPPVGQISDAVTIDGQTQVVKYHPLYARVAAVADGVALRFAQLSVTGGADHAAAMHFLARQTQPFRVADLPGLDAAQQTELARSLIATGFLIRLDS